MDEEAASLGCRIKIQGNSHLNHGPRTLKLGKWCPGAEVDACTKRQFVTESNNINSLADHYIWSTIKTLPATLPELRTVDHGPGLLEPFLSQIWT
jgi:hypothetical protein